MIVKNLRIRLIQKKHSGLDIVMNNGIEIEKNENKAFTYYQKSANMNNSDGIYYVSHCYDLGIEVEVDKKKAFEYYLKSAKSDNSMGIFKTAV
ncbi:calmodulin-dependent protein kinase [Gigaspora margarita]|uniref:Calmodulin-dependent protein kinase n=1 Tax=Gigaspora margarita TaxID=4874 RepID=A0A8H3XBI6_GIGMA|nr:calmodulin-dependent protein kinase [Gigaspora margarita]